MSWLRYISQFLQIRSIIEIFLLMPNKKSIAFILFAIIFTAILLFAFIWLDTLLQSQISNKNVLRKDNQDLWSISPGKSKSPTIKKYTFYNFTNPRRYLFQSEKPNFREIQGYEFEEGIQLTNIQFSSDLSEVNTNFWQYMTTSNQSRSLEQRVQVINFALIGFMTKIKQAPLQTIALQGFGLFYTELNRTFKTQIIGQAVHTKYLRNYTALSKYCKMLQIEEEACDLLWNDKSSGLSNPANYFAWTQFAFENNLEAEMQLQDSLGLDRMQLLKLKQLLYSWCSSIDDILNNVFCEGEVCTSQLLAIEQISSAAITKNSPSGEPVDSICMKGNQSCSGFPEFSAFLQYQFPKINNDSKYQKLTFRKQTIMEVIHFVLQLFRAYTGTFLNVGNLTNFFKIGYLLDQVKDNQTALTVKYLVILKEMCSAETNDHAFVIWQYAKYFSKQFVLHESQNVTRTMVLMSNIFADYFYASFSKFKNWILSELLSLLSAQSIGDCTAFMNKIINGQKVKRICEGVTVEDYKSYWKLLSICNHQIYQSYDEYKQRYNLTSSQLEQLCDKTKESIYTVLQASHKKIYLHYNCSILSWKSKCTSYELTLKQFINSTITLHPISTNQSKYPSVLTAKLWNSALEQFQYKHFLKEAFGNQEVSPNHFTTDYQELSHLLSFDRLFNGQMVIKLLSINNQIIFRQKFYWKNATFLKDYVKFVVTEIAFGGIALTKTVKQLLFGFEVPFLKRLKQKNTMLGGDPTIKTILMLNNANLTENEVNYPYTLYTGEDDRSKTRKIKSIFNQSFISYNHTWYDGYQRQSEMITPYREKVTHTAGDGKQFHVGLKKDERVQFYLQPILRICRFQFLEETTLHGFDLYKYQMIDSELAPEDEEPNNKIYYQSLKGFFNMSANGLPFYVSKQHFYGADQKWMQLIEIFDQTGEKKQRTTQKDRFMNIQIEPFSGMNFGGDITMLTSAFTTQDELFQSERTMLPVFCLQKIATVSQYAATELLSDLKMVINLKFKIILVGIIGLIVILALFVILKLLRRRKRMEQQNIKVSLLESIETQIEDTFDQNESKDIQISKQQKESLLTNENQEELN